VPVRGTDRPVVTFDLFSALVNSRAGAAAFFDALGPRRGWSVTGTEVYDEWDRRNKAAHRGVTEWVPFLDLSRGALAETYDVLGLAGDPREDVDAVYEAVGEWPLWPDVGEALPVLAERFRVGLLSNVDDVVFRRTRAAAYVDAELAMTSQRLGYYKPDPRLYLAADAAIGPIVHVATSARDVRGALEAGIAVVRLRRPGHQLDPEGPAPPYEVSGLLDLPEQVTRARAARGKSRTGPGTGLGVGS
jgi:2-haloacid dehalogenase